MTESCSKFSLCSTFTFSELDDLPCRVNVGRDSPGWQNERRRDVDSLAFVAQKVSYRDFDREFGNSKSPPDRDDRLSLLDLSNTTTLLPPPRTKSPLFLECRGT